METTDIITTLAEIAIALVGFSAIVVVLNPRPIRDWAESDQFNFRILVQLSAIVVVFCILPFGTHILLDDDQAWKSALLIYGIVHVIDLLSFIIRFAKHVPRANRILPFLGMIVAVSQIIVAMLAGPKLVELTYLVALVWHLFVAFISFVILVYGFGERSNTS